MCTAFVYRKESVFIGMNFDNDGKEFTIQTSPGGGFLVNVKLNNTFFPSVRGQPERYFRQRPDGRLLRRLASINGRTRSAGLPPPWSSLRWAWSLLSDVCDLLQRLEIVNGPGCSTHNLIVDRHGSACIVEPGRKNLFSNPSDSEWLVMTNFPLSDYVEVVPTRVVGGGTDRYVKTLEMLSNLQQPLSIDKCFEILKTVSQNGPEWWTEISLVYDPARNEVSYCLEQDFGKIECRSVNIQHSS